MESDSQTTITLNLTPAQFHELRKAVYLNRNDRQEGLKVLVETFGAESGDAIRARKFWTAADELVGAIKALGLAPYGS